jgi:hypothetical protein
MAVPTPATAVQAAMIARRQGPELDAAVEQLNIDPVSP